MDKGLQGVVKLVASFFTWLKLILNEARQFYMRYREKKLKLSALRLKKLSPSEGIKAGIRFVEEVFSLKRRESG